MKKDLIFAPIMLLVGAALCLLKFTGMNVHIALSVVGILVLAIYTALTVKQWEIPALEIVMRACYGIALISGIVIMNVQGIAPLAIIHKLSALFFLVALIALGVAVICVGMGYTAVKNGEDTTTTVVTVDPTTTAATTTTQPTTETTTEKEPELSELLLGKWSDSAGMSGFEFFSDGKVSFTYANLESLGLSFDGVLKNGTYTLDGNKLTIAYSIYTATIDKTYEIL